MAKATRGEIWEVEFHPAVGAEIQKLRPAVVMNIPEVGRLPLCIVVPVTDWKQVPKTNLSSAANPGAHSRVMGCQHR